jgi:fluoroacetyl-CoA thioesterase
MPDVFATAMMIGFAEQTCIQALRPYLEEGHGTVGISVKMNHVAPTPIGGKVTASVELKSVEGRRYMFDVQISDTHGVIGVGSHERALINIAKFEQTVSRRKLGS